METESLTIKQSQWEQWVLDNYLSYRLTYVAATANMTVPQVEKLLLKNGIDLSLSKEDQEYIRLNYWELTVDEIIYDIKKPTDNILLLKCRIINFLHRNDIKKNYRVQTVKKPFLRAKPDHQNMNHSDRISFWCNMTDKEIKNHKGRIKY